MHRFGSNETLRAEVTFFEVTEFGENPTQAGPSLSGLDCTLFLLVVIGVDALNHYKMAAIQIGGHT